MLIENREPWGSVRYDTATHQFTFEESDNRSTGPYVSRPVVLNVVLTHKCNMGCIHCVAQDFAGICQDDLNVSDELIATIRRSPFMVIVITGGEPFLPSAEPALRALIEGIPDRGIVVDTNGTVEPSKGLLRLLKQRQALVRVSVDSVQSIDEIQLRQAKSGKTEDAVDLYEEKIGRLSQLRDAKIATALQTVVYNSGTGKKPRDPVFQIVDLMNYQHIHHWYLQRLIPSHRLKNPPPGFKLNQERYEDLASQLVKAARSAGIQAFGKRDRRHNSVLLLVGDAVLYTQGAAPGDKVRLGDLAEYVDGDRCFEYVSAPDHAVRYYCDKTE